MKTIYKIISIIIFLATVGCKNKQSVTNHFTYSKDTLIIKTKKIKGNGLFSMGASTLNFKDTLEKFPYSIKSPEHIQEIQRFLLEPDFKEKTHYYVNTIKGKQNGQNVFIVDDNNNKDLTDDTIRPYEKIKWFSSQNLIKCNYLISDGQKIISDSSRLKIGTSNNKLLIGRSEHLIGEFSIGHKNYKVGIAELRNATSFTYGLDSNIVLLQNNRKAKDSISDRDLLKTGELLNLNKNFYRFETISNNGAFFTLVKVRDFKNKIGTQLGMKAPSFNIVTTKGDTIENTKFNNKFFVIANTCGCGGDTKSTQAFYDIKNNFKNINVLHIDSKIDTKLEGLHVEMENDFNKDFYKNYRMEYCSRICYVVGKDKRIIDKFNITDWKTILPEILK